jgi:hypothetical protein
MIPSLPQLAAACAALLDESPGADYEAAATKALWHLGRGVEVMELPGAWLIPSGTQAGTVYRVTAALCSCAASGPCWHRACVVIVEQARLQTYARACVEIEELFA